MITKRCRDTKIFLSHYLSGYTEAQIKWVSSQYYQIIDGRMICVYFHNQPLCYLMAEDIDQYFYTLVEERELKLLELGL